MYCTNRGGGDNIYFDMKYKCIVGKIKLDERMKIKLQVIIRRILMYLNELTELKQCRERV